MREEIRLGNEALAQNDMESAKQHFQQLLDNGGTPRRSILPRTACERFMSSKRHSVLRHR